MTTITTRTDLINYLSDVRCDVDALPRGEEYIAAMADQIQASDHPAWGQDWTEWLGEVLDDTFVETVVDGVDAIEPEDDEDEDGDISDCYIMTCASGAIVLVSASSAEQAEEAWDADEAEPRVTEASPATREDVEACVHTGHDYR